MAEAPVDAETELRSWERLLPYRSLMGVLRVPVPLPDCPPRPRGGVVTRSWPLRWKRRRTRTSSNGAYAALKASVTVLALLAFGVVGVGCSDSSTAISVISTLDSSTTVDERGLLAGLESNEDARLDQFNGAVLVARNDQVLFAKAYGLADREEEIPNTVQTRHRIGSMNKMFTAVAILQLVEAGKVELDATVGDYLTDYPNEEVASNVTVHQLLTHTGGTGDIFGPEFDAHRLELRIHDDYLELYGTREPEFEPGSQHVYSNYGYVLLGAVIEHVTGQNYDEYVQEQIYEPAGMVATGSLPEEVDVPNRSVGYMGTPTNLVPNSDTLPYRGTAAGGGYSTVEDLARFGHAILNHELLSPDGTDLLLNAKVDSGYAYGFVDLRETEGFVGHGGGAPGMNGDLRLFPESSYVIAVLANMDPPAAFPISTYLTARIEADD